MQEHISQVFENKVPRKISGRKKDDARRDSCDLYRSRGAVMVAKCRSRWVSKQLGLRVFLYDLFNIAFNSSDCTASRGRIINE
jgi:hypothetical protein